MPPEGRKSFLLRIDPALWRELEGWASDELRSANGQIEWVLKEAVRRRKGAGKSGGLGENSEAGGQTGG